MMSLPIIPCCSICWVYVSQANVARLSTVTPAYEFAGEISTEMQLSKAKTGVILMELNDSLPAVNDVVAVQAA